MNILLTILGIVFIITIITYFKAKDGTRTIVVYEDWDDVGLSFFSIFFPIVVTMLMQNSENFSKYALQFGLIIMFFLLGKLALDTYKSNNGNIVFFLMAILTKIFLGVTLFIQIMNIINPNKDKDENSNFGSAVLILLIVIPIINNLVVKKSQGSKINPFSWVKKRIHYTKLV